MTEKNENLKNLGKIVAEEINHEIDGVRMDGQRSALAYAMGRKKTPGWLRFSLPAAVAALLIVVFSWYSMTRTERPLEFRLGSGARGVEGSLLQTAGRQFPISFEGGSEIKMLGQTTGRVLASTTKQVRFELKSGKISASIRHRDNVKWIFEAGDYMITVAGTKFSVDWSPLDSRMEVAVSEGKVLVTGPGLGPQGELLSRGESWHSPGAGKALLVQSDTSARKPADESPCPKTEVTDNGKGNARLEPAAGEKTPSEETWKDLFNQGRYAQSVEAAEKTGLDDLLASLDQNDLWLLADACRFAKKGKRAAEVLTAIRQRFPDSAQTKIAAFLLGRVTIELNKNPAGAAQWFKVYLEEDPDGPLAEEATGRLIKACKAAGREEEALEAAKVYMEKYPDGIFSTLAQSVLEQ